jgi:hypothetical protein
MRCDNPADSFGNVARHDFMSGWRNVEKMLEYQVDKVSLSALKDIECMLEHRMEAGTLSGCRNFEGCKDIAWMQEYYRLQGR